MAKLLRLLRKAALLPAIRCFPGSSIPLAGHVRGERALSLFWY
jgi:hypothetical protein